MLESTYQRRLIKRLKKNFPGIIILKNDSGYIQGIPDLTLLYKSHWALLEVKPDENAKHEPNQDWYIQLATEMSFGAFVFPENEEDVFNALQQVFTSGRYSRIPKRKQVPLDQLRRGQTRTCLRLHASSTTGCRTPCVCSGSDSIGSDANT